LYYTLSSNFPRKRRYIVAQISSFIKRNSLFLQLQNILEKKDPKDVNARFAILCGDRGAGKKTLARLYAKKSSCNITWELNGQSLETLYHSFLQLSHALAKSLNEQEELRSIKAIKDPHMRKERLIAFVQNFLKKSSSWMFIFNQVESIGLVKSFLSSDLEKWRNGACIIIMNENFSKNIPEEYKGNVIRVDYLMDDEALRLFSKIYYNANFSQLPRKRQIDVEEILKLVPLYPLDVILTAQDARRSKFSLRAYTHKFRIHRNCGFHINASREDMQIAIRKKNMYNIFNHITSIDQAHKSLLFLVSFCLPSAIPKSFLLTEESASVVKNFIKILKKNALVAEYKVKDEGGLIEIVSFCKDFQDHGPVFFKNTMSSQEIDFLMIQSIEAIRSFLAKETQLDCMISLNWVSCLEKLIQRIEDFGFSKIDIKKHINEISFILEKLHYMAGEIKNLNVPSHLNDNESKENEKSINALVSFKKFPLLCSYFMNLAQHCVPSKSFCINPPSLLRF
jgi:hypothetical protein